MDLFFTTMNMCWYWTVCFKFVDWWSFSWWIWRFWWTSGCISHWNNEEEDQKRKHKCVSRISSLLFLLLLRFWFLLVLVWIILIYSFLLCLRNFFCLIADQHWQINFQKVLDLKTHIGVLWRSWNVKLRCTKKKSWKKRSIDVCVYSSACFSHQPTPDK